MGQKHFAVVVATAVFGVMAAPAGAAVPDLERTSATELEAKLSAGELTPVELTKAYIDRIAAVNQRGPAINAVRSLNPNALKEARVSDLARRDAQRPRAARGPSGSAQGQHRRRRDADHGVLDRARALGARQGRVRRAAAEGRGRGDPRQGQPDRVRRVGVQQPVQRQRVAARPGAEPVRHVDRSGGSSAGSGVAAAAGLAALVLGSDTEGSILSPATQNGVVGIRPTTGLWSRTGVVPISESQDTLGPLVQTTSDAALLLNTLTGGRSGGPAHGRHGPGGGDRLLGGTEADRAAGRADRGQQLHQRAVRRARRPRSRASARRSSRSRSRTSRPRSRCRRASSAATSTTTCRGCPRARRSRATTRPTRTSTRTRRRG